MKKLLLLLPLLALFAAPAARAQTPSIVSCIQISTTPCNTSFNPGAGNQGDPAWLAFGKVNLNFDFLAPLWSLPANVLVGSTSAGSIGPITIGAGLSLSSNVLSAIGGGGGTCPAGSSGQLLYNNAGVCGGVTVAGDGIFNASTGQLTISKLGGVSIGTFATANTATPPPIGNVTPNSGAFSSIIDTAVTGLTQCVQANTSGIFSGTGSPCPLDVAAGTAALGTALIASGACATAVASSATGVLTTDTVQWTFNADPTSTVGYQPSTNGMLTIISYPTSGNVNFKVCNNTAAGVTPGAVTLNWRVAR